MNQLLIVLSLIVLFFQQVNARIHTLEQGVLKIPFHSDQNNDYYFELSVGIPSQKIQVSMFNFQSDKYLTVVNKENGGQYDELHSSSFKNETMKVDYNNKYVGYWANETFQIGSTQLNRGEVKFILQVTDHVYQADVGFIYIDRYSFWDQMMEPMDSSQITVAFENYPKNGYISVGGFDEERCYNDWNVVKLEKWRDLNKLSKFGVKADKLLIGESDTWDSAFYMGFDLKNVPVKWPRHLYIFIVESLGSTNNRTFPCDTNKTLDFYVQTWIFTLTPEEYIDQELKNATGECVLTGAPNWNEGKNDGIIFPRSFFNKHCISFDFCHEEFGVGLRRPNPPSKEETTSTTSKDTNDKLNPKMTTLQGPVGHGNPNGDEESFGISFNVKNMMSIILSVLVIVKIVF